MATYFEVINAMAADALSPALRLASQVPELASEASVAAWLERELAGYFDGSEVPSYRRARPMNRVGSATNGYWAHTNTPLPTDAFPARMRDTLDRPIELRDGLPQIEQLLAEGGPTFLMQWGSRAVHSLNQLVAAGATRFESSYQFQQVGDQISAAQFHRIIESARAELLRVLDEHVPPANRQPPEPPTVPGQVTVAGESNQVIIGSPNAVSLYQNVDVTSREHLVQALLQLGVGPDSVSELEQILDSDDDQPSKVMRALGWAKQAGIALGLNAAGSGAATLILQHLGLL